MKSKPKNTSSIFKDLDLKNPEELSAKAELTRQVYEVIIEKKLTQIQVSELTGIKQPDISKLMNGRFTGFSIDRLLGILNGLGRDVDIVVSKKKARNFVGEIRVKIA